MNRDPETVPGKIEQLRSELRLVLLRKRGAGHLNMYTRGMLEGQRKTLLEFLLWLRPGYQVEGDTPRICAASDCSEVFFRSAHRPDQAFHTRQCQNRTWMRARREEQKELAVIEARKEGK